MKTLSLLAFLLFVVGAWFFLYKAINPQQLEAKEVRGLIKESTSYASEISELEQAKKLSRVTSVFAKTQTEDIFDSVVEIRDAVQTSDFEQNILPYKEAVLSSLQNIVKDVGNIKEGTSTPEILDDLQLNSEKLTAINKFI